MGCQKCESDRLVSIGGKTSDCCYALIKGRQHDGYVPSDMGVGGGDYLKFELCLNCGQVQGQFPLPISELEEKPLPVECPGCGQEMMVNEEGVFPYHDWPRFTRRVCPGSKTRPT